MAAKGTILQNALNNAAKKGITNIRSKESIDWFRKNIRKTAVDPSRLIREERKHLVDSWTQVGIGKMYFVFYDPKHKATLPYYDTFPMIIPLRRYKDGILGLNTHYLPPILRAKLLDALYDTLNNDKLDETTKMKINYGILKSASKYKYFSPCIKRYLGNHFRSRFIQVPPESWTTAIFLPTESFEKANKTTVWTDSRDMINGV